MLCDEARWCYRTSYSEFIIGYSGYEYMYFIRCPFYCRDCALRHKACELHVGSWWGKADRLWWVILAMLNLAFAVCMIRASQFGLLKSVLTECRYRISMRYVTLAACSKFLVAIPDTKSFSLTPRIAVSTINCIYIIYSSGKTVTACTSHGLSLFALCCLLPALPFSCTVTCISGYIDGNIEV